MYKRVQGSLDKVTGNTRENLTGVRAVRAFRLEQSETEAFIENNRVLQGLQKAVGKISAFLNPLTYVLINLGVLAILFFGGRAVSRGLITTGTVVALVNYMNQILVELIKLANLIVQMTRAAASLRRIEEVLKPRPDDEPETIADGETAADPDDAPSGNAPAVRFSHVSMQYGTSGSESLSDVSFEVQKGETVGIIGGTGSGKTTLVSLIPGFYPASVGEIEIEGKPVSEYGKAELRGKIGMVMQKALLFKGTVRDTLKMGNALASDEDLWRALENAQAAEFVREKEGGLDASVEETGRNFSGGQKQRLSIARALVKEPDILILDDSSSALDFATDAALREAIAGMPGNMTIFIVSQRTASIMNADRILVLEDGRLVGNGTHGELMEHCPVYREIYDSQFH
jgi:ABC-type multidrug transport system fused ATPase/permease subunit